jgi:ATP-dependent helicase/nuclease subunit B
MGEKRANVFTIASDAPFLDILAAEILNGFPLEGAKPDLAALTILVPTRRAARELEIKLLGQSKQQALVLPSIVPIGDIDEEEIEERPEPGLPDAISSLGRQFLLVSLIDEWISENPQQLLAEEIRNSPLQAQALAVSMGELVDGLETDEVPFERLSEVFDIDLAMHQGAILGLLEVIKKQLPAELHKESLIGSKKRRSLQIRREAKDISEGLAKGPIIAAGSTGTIPATRELLKAIAHLENGAVVLPGLDLGMDEDSWNCVTPQHPQYALKELLEVLEVDRMEVSVLGAEAGNRAWVASELMRPSDVADQWQRALAGQQQRMRDGLADFSLIKARDKNEEAAIIALLMRRELEKPAGDMALVTPDRDLARRVKAALLRWNIQVDDSAGEPLIRFGAASLLSLLMDAVISKFDAPSLVALFSNPLSRFGLERNAFQRAARNIDLVLFRDAPMGNGLNALIHAYERARMSKDVRRHGLIENLSEEDWHDIGNCVKQVVESLAPLTNFDMASFNDHLARLLSVARNVAGEDFWVGAEAEALETLITELQDEGHRFPECNFQRAATAIRHNLQLATLRNRRGAGTRLSILGLLEARLIRPETIILGGLNEGKWPRQPDAGPWLNRPMRDVFSMPQPERQIGQMAHDFVQAFGAGRVYLTTSRRDGMTPAIPSRWILRLETIMQAVGLKLEDLPNEPWQQWATALDEAGTVTPFKKPLPRPPVAARPQKLSVTRIEKFIRDPYAIYASAILKLEPLPELSAKPNAALRGSLFHEALGDFFKQYPGPLPEEAVEKLMAFGRKHFEPYNDNAEISGFWWARFKRVAHWIIENEPALRGNATWIIAEVSGALEFPVGDSKFKLTARADRIDILPGSTAHIIDFKTGGVPSADQVAKKFSPQLTLEAAMLANGAFAGAGKHQTAALTYVRITGGVPPGELKPVKIPVMDAALAHLASLTRLLLDYQSVQQAYPPRFGFNSEDDASEFDHLSRYQEWLLSGDAP